MAKRISIFGSTGSIGMNALEVVRRNRGRFEVAVLASHSNTDLLLKQIEEFRPETVVLFDEEAATRLRDRKPGCVVGSGLSALTEVAAIPVDVVLCAVVGAVGVYPLLAAIDAGNRVAVANKEPLVMAGRFIMDRARKRGVEVLPVDSEHNAIFQCLAGRDAGDVWRIHLTASGGPFYRCAPEELRHITPKQASRHPTWDMGTKISVDSATLMNKGLEIIEAMCLFGVESRQIEVVIHPQSTIHSMVEFHDGSIIAQLGVTDMKIPITYALNYPERLPAPELRLDLTALPGLTFHKPDYQAFPCLALARAAADTGGCAPAILNAANEVAVEAFCANRIAFLDIASVVAETLEHCPASRDWCLDAVLETNRVARDCAASIVNRLET